MEKHLLQLNGAHAAPQQQLGAYGSAPVVQPAAGSSDALWVPVEEGVGAELAVEHAVVEAVRRLLPSLAIDVRADLQARSPFSLFSRAPDSRLLQRFCCLFAEALL